MVNANKRNPHAPAVTRHAAADATEEQRRIYDEEAKADADGIQQRLNNVENPTPAQVQDAVAEYMGIDPLAFQEPQMTIQAGQELSSEEFASAAVTAITFLIREMFVTNYYLMTTVPLNEPLSNEMVELFDRVRDAEVNLRNGIVALASPRPPSWTPDENSSG